jgi:hypothetical protein
LYLGVTDIYTAIMDAYRRVEARKTVERKIAEAIRAKDERDRRRYPRRFE